MKVIMWGASWCAPCKKEKPKTEDLCKDLGVEFAYQSIDDYEFEVKEKGIMSVPTWEIEEKFFTSYLSLKNFLLEKTKQ